MTTAFLKDSNRLYFVKVVQRLQLGVFTEEHISLDPVWEERLGLVRDMFAGRHGKDVVELFQRALHRLGHEEENHDECNDVQSCIEAESYEKRKSS
jgi:hypothetical protein